MDIVSSLAMVLVPTKNIKPEKEGFFVFFFLGLTLVLVPKYTSYTERKSPAAMLGLIERIRQALMEITTTANTVEVEAVLA